MQPMMLWDPVRRKKYNQYTLILFLVVFLLIILQIASPGQPFYFFAVFGIIILFVAARWILSIRDITKGASKPGSGGILGSIVSNVTGAGAAEEVAQSLRQFGVNADVIKLDSPNIYGGSANTGRIGNLSLVAVKVEGRNIDRIEPNWTRSGKHSYITFSYQVKADPKDLQQDLTSVLMPKRDRSVLGSIVDYKWVDTVPGFPGGWGINLGLFLFGLVFMGFGLFEIILMLNTIAEFEIAMVPLALVPTLFAAIGFLLSFGQIFFLKRRRYEGNNLLSRALNADFSLKQMLLNAHHTDWTTVAPSLDGSSVSIGGSFPTREKFEIYDAIASHVLSLVPDSSSFGEYLPHQSVEGSEIRQKVPYRTVSTRQVIIGPVFIIAFALCWFGAAFFITGGNMEELLIPLLMAGLFIAIGVVALITQIRNLANQNKSH
ncbi:MAG: hypothetical protein LUP94_02445 [Candidatus Methanomethylicus sp.]|nr:hypothetical protein [Candidatus Methanomethylicus sp.]